MNSTKVCIGCSAEKSSIEYYQDKRRDGSIAGRCKACCRARVTAWRKANAERVREYKRRGPKGKRRVRDRAKMKEYNRKYNTTEKARLARRRWKERHVGTEQFKKSQQRSSQRHRWPREIMARYGLTVEAYAWMLYGQDFCCAICNNTLAVEVIQHEDQAKKLRPCVDHEHETGRVRGILCSGCNYKIIGGLESGGDVLIVRALRYLGWDATKKDAHALRKAIEELS